MPMMCQRGVFTLRGLIAFLAAWLGLMAAEALFLAAPAEANVNCELAESPARLDFGSALRATGTIRYRCTNFDPVPRSFTLCAGFGNPQYPGTPSQPRMQGPGGRVIDFNLYVNQAITQVWTPTNPITAAVTIPPNGTISGNFTYHGAIAEGQPAPTGSYDGYIHETVLGFRAMGAQTCVDRLGDLGGLRFTIFVNKAVAQACTLGTIAPIDFGTPPIGWVQADATGSVQVNCPAGTNWTLRFNAGQYPSGGERRMRSPGGDYLPYRLYRDAGRTQSLPIDGTISGTGTGNLQPSLLHGRVTVTRAPPAGEYADVVIVVLSF